MGFAQVIVRDEADGKPSASIIFMPPIAWKLRKILELRVSAVEWCEIVPTKLGKTL